MNRLVSTSAGVFAAIGAAGLLKPSLVPSAYGGIAQTANARSEIRGVYGGATLATAALLLTSPTAALPVSVITGGMAAGRLAGLALEMQRPNAANLVSLLVEVVIAAGLFRHHRTLKSMK